MNYIELEEKLRERIKKRRIIEAALSVAFLIIVIVFSVLYEQSKVVEEISFGPIKYQDITYNNDFTWGILVGALGFVPTVIYLICDFIFSSRYIRLLGSFTEQSRNLELTLFISMIISLFSPSSTDLPKAVILLIIL